MKVINKILFVLVISLIALSSFAQKKVIFKPKEIYKTSSLVITQISENAFTLSGTKLSTQLLITTLALFADTGIFSISPKPCDNQ